MNQASIHLDSVFFPRFQAMIDAEFVECLNILVSNGANPMICNIVELARLYEPKERALDAIAALITGCRGRDLDLLSSKERKFVLGMRQRLISSIIRHWGNLTNRTAMAD